MLFSDIDKDLKMLAVLKLVFTAVSTVIGDSTNNTNIVYMYLS